MREVHRIEHGIPRHDHEFGRGITPRQADLLRIVRLSTPFIGKQALQEAMRSRLDRILRSVIMNSRRVPERDTAVLHAGRPVGVISSGTFSLALRRGLALAYVDPALDAGALVTVETAGQAVTGCLAPGPAQPGSGKSA